MALGELRQRVELRARHLALPGVDRPHDAGWVRPIQHGRKDLELRRAQRVRHVVDLEAEARVGAVGAVAQQRLVVGHARVGRLPHVQAADVEDLRHQPLVDVDHVVLGDEGHLEVQLRELGLAVGTQVLVAKAARDLEVALVAADHQQLLEQLRRLRQRVEGSVLHARGDEEVARALGRRARQGRRLDLEEVLRRQSLADRPHDLVAQHERLDHVAAAQVERAVAQAQRLVERDVLVERKRRRLRLGQQLHVADLQLDRAGREVGVDVALLAQHDVAGDADDVLAAQPLGGGEQLGPVLGMKDELQQSRAVAQVDEDQPAVVAAAVHPAGDAQAFADPVWSGGSGPRIAQAIGAGGLHRAVSTAERPTMARASSTAWSASVASSSPRLRMSRTRMPVPSTMTTTLAPSRLACLS